MTNDEIPNDEIFSLRFLRLLPYVGRGLSSHSFAAPIQRNLGIWVFGYFVIACACAAPSFDEQRDAIKSSIQTQPEEKISSLLQAGIAEGKAALAIADGQKWLQQNLPKDPMLLYHAGRAAELAGDWKVAAALYQQFLAQADLKSDAADDAAYATYELLVNRLNDVSGAYAFGRNVGHKTTVSPQARQFDGWFLGEAMRRKDATAVASRLYACHAAGVSQDLLDVHYGSTYRWLLDQVSGYSDHRSHTVLATPAVMKAYKNLIQAMPAGSEMRLKLDWGVSVLAYNQSRFNGSPSEVKPPIAEAKALLAKFPQYAKWVQDGWAGGGNGRHYRNDTKHYWPHQIEAKMAPIVAAAAKLNPDQLAGLIQSWRDRYYDDNAVRPLNVKVVREFVMAKPKRMNSRNGPLVLSKPWDKMTPQEATALAPKIAKNRSVTVSHLRALAAAGKEKNFEKAIDALLGPEAWRLNERIDMHHAGGYHLSNLLGAKGDKAAHKRANEKMADLVKKFKAEDPKADAPAAKRIAAFKKLWQDYRSPQPKEPAVYSRLVKILKFTPEAIPELMKDPSPDAQSLVRNVIANGIAGADPVWKELESGKVNVNSYAPGIVYLAKRHSRGVIADLKKRHPKKCVPHPLESAMRKVVEDSLKQKTLQPWQVIAWINMQYPENNGEQIKLVKALIKDPSWKGMPFEVKFAAREWFKKHAMTAGQAAWIDAANPKIACKELLALPKGADAAATVAALKAAIDDVKKSPRKINVRGLETLAALDHAVLTDPQVMEQIMIITEQLRFSCDRESEPFGAKLLTHVQKTRDPVVVQRTGAFLWSYGMSEHYARSLPKTLKLAESFLDKNPTTAAALAKTALTTFSKRPNEHQRKWAERGGQVALKSLIGKSAMKMGLVVIPVPRNHVAYPVYKSQAEWLTANEDSAWEMLDENWDQLLPIHRELSTNYLTWALQRAIYSRNEVRQEELATALLDWAQGEGSPWGLNQKIDLEIAYGDIAMQMGRLDAAHKIFTATQKKAAYAETTARHKATLRRVRVERIAKRFDDALKTLSELDLERIPEFWSASRYARAEVYYDMEEYDDAADDVNAILARDSSHAEAKIMQGKVQLKRKKLMEASELDVGSKDAQKTMVPGENLKVTLSDPTLAVSGAGTEIEVVVTAESGDKETFFLRQFGDEKTKFRGEVRTALGKPVPGDRVLQVIGDDKIFYAYSERFRKKMNNMEAKRGGPITVKSDAILMASARRLLSADEQRIADMKKEMDAISRGGRDQITAGGQAVLAARKAIDKAQQREVGEASDEDEKAKLAQDLVRARVKPGKAINVRVIDPDRSRTADVDELVVSVESSSGDSVGRITLKETGTHTGWFEASIPTAPAQAMAFAQNSQPGRNPNMVISPKTDYPAWRPVASKNPNEKPSFRIDLNDNVALGKMTISANEAGAKLKKFVVQTGMNERSMTTVGVYPKDQVTLDKPWHPSVTIMNDTDHHHVRNDRSVYDLRELREHVDFGWITQRFAAGIAENVVGPSVAMSKAIHGKVKWQRQNRHHNAHVVYRFRGYFYEPATVTRRFKVQLGNFQIPKKTHPSVAHPPQFLLAVNGRAITNKEKPKQLEGQMNLRPGVHSFEIWATGWDNTIGFGRDLKLFANLDAEDTEKLVPCPDSFFDPGAFPRGVLGQSNGRAKIASADGKTFSVDFAEKSRTRLLNIVLVDQEGPVPALNRIELTAADGKTVLPVKEDFAALNKNDVLEILTGDKVAIRYVDDRFVSKAKENLERFLNVSFSDGTTAFQFHEMRKNRGGEMEPHYEKQLRFAHNKPLLLTINDPDMDMTDKPDVVKVTLESKSGGKKTVDVTEDDSSSGIFRMSITPVAGAAAGADQFQAGVGETITAIYRDMENVKPGVPIDREAVIAHATYAEPQIFVSHATVSPVDPSQFETPPGMRALRVGFDRLGERVLDDDDNSSEGLLAEKKRRQESTGGRIRPRWQVQSSFVDGAKPPEGGHAAVHGQTMHFRLNVPHLAQRIGSTVPVYVQTDAGRKRAGQAGPGFDVTIPGTVELSGVLKDVNGKGGPGARDWRMTPQSPIYLGGRPQFEKGQRPHWSGLFVCEIPLIAGFLPDEGALDPDEIEQRRKQKLYSEPHGLVVQPGERIHVGFPYTDASGAEKWLTATAKVITQPVFDVMDEDYRDERSDVYVGESLFLRVVDLGADVSDASDVVSLLVQAKSGAKHRVELQEVDSHTGVFQGVYQLSYRQDDTADAEDYDVRRDGFPVIYGDAVRSVYKDRNGTKTDVVSLTVSKGADGSVSPFSKKYEDPEIAMKTQFALAEAFLEMAKRHRKLGEGEKAEHEYARAKDMLEKAMEMFKDPDTRAQAEYLLGNLTQEEADTTQDPELKEDRYRAALSRYMRVTGSYEETLAASKAQFKIATVYERLKEPEIAAQEYVKLAYKYPDSEFLALSMARLGTHFQRRAATYEKQAETLLEQTEDKDAQFDGKAMQKMMVLEYMKSAEIFGRLQERFPDHELAGKCGLRAGQAYMRAGEHRHAIAAFKRVSGYESYDGPEIRAQAMYWMGLCYENTRQDMAAYSQYKRLGYDFPESKWASYARGQLSQDKLLNIETDIETKRLEEGR